MTTKRTTRDRHRKATQVNDPETVKLFAAIEKIPWPFRDQDDATYAKQDDLAWRLGLHSEFRFDAERVNDLSLIDCRPGQDQDFRLEGWLRVTAMRKTLLELAGLPPDPPLFWCRICGKINTSATAIRTRRCAACHEVDYVRRRELEGMAKKAEAS
jgi:hypothetical protein